jgi:class 3 adenylate cyclase/tetratricopeptide (TPR) repeat protein
MSNKHPLERRQLTVMLCDLVDSTALSMRLDAEELTELIQDYRQRCAAIINHHGGVVARYVGDGILAYFGYPRAHEDDAERALRAALGIIATTAQSPSGGTDVQVHIGIATGVVVVGDLSGSAHSSTEGTSSGQGAEPEAVGSALNLAARLEALAEPGTVVVSEQTRRLTRGIFEYADLGQHSLKGFDAPIQAWQVMGESNIHGRFHALRTSALTPLVDRQTELQKLREIWTAVQNGQGKAVLLSSEPGVGKSRLSEEVATHIAGRHCLRLWYYCSSHLQSTPLEPLIRQLALAAGFAEGDNTDLKLRKLSGLIPANVDRSMEIVPLLASLLSVPYESLYPPLQMSVQRQKHRLFQVLMHLLEVFASRRPVLLVVEDLHWIDPSTDELIGVLIDRLKQLPALLLLTARPEFQSHWDDKTQLVHMPLVPLGRNDSIAMIELLCANRNIPQPTVDQIADKTDGLPLFIEDLTRDMLELAELQRAEGVAVKHETRPALAIPATLTDSLMARLDRLGSAKRVVQIGAVIGREFSYELLSKVTDIPEETLKEELYRLVESGMLLRSRSTDVLTHVFKHALVRDAAYSSLLKKEQAALHARIARVLVDEFPETANEQPELLANHLEAAGQIDHAVPYLIKAAQVSASRSGFVEAITQLERGLRLLQTQPRSSSRTRQEMQLYLTLGDINAEYRGFSANECGNAYIKGLELCRELGDEPEIFSVLSRVGSFHITRAMFPQCRAAGEECLSRAAGQTSKPPFVMGHRLLGGTSFLAGEFTTARRHLEQALALYEQDETPYRSTQILYVQDQKSTVLCYLALTLSILGYLDSGLRAAEDSLRHSRSLGDPHTVNFSLCFLAAVLHIRRDSPQALRVATESLELAREQGFATWVGISQMIRGASLAHNGNCADGLKEIHAGMNAHSEMAAGAYQPFGISLFVEGLIVDGRLDEALGALTQALAISSKSGECFYAAELLRLNGEILAKQGKLTEAEHWWRKSIELSRQQQAKLFELRSATELCRTLRTPQREAALRDTLKPAYRWFEEGNDALDMRRARALLTLTNETSVED